MSSLQSGTQCSSLIIWTRYVDVPSFPTVRSGRHVFLTVSILLVQLPTSAYANLTARAAPGGHFQ